MIWFKHPNDLPNDKRLAALIDNEGCRGYGMYLRIIEMLCAPVSYTHLTLPTKLEV